MRERPILFSGPMVRAILGGRKTQTRRVVKNPPAAQFCGLKSSLGYPASEGSTWAGFGNPSDPMYVRCPYGQPGDRLWVRETWADVHPLQVAEGRYTQQGRAGIPGPPPVDYQTVYRADGEYPPIYCLGGEPWPYRSLEPFEREGLPAFVEEPAWTPSIHMPRWACRLVLEITDVRVERLQAISYEDALAEGAMDGAAFCEALEPGKRNALGESAEETAKRLQWPQQSFERLWASIHGQVSWDANPWAWAISFKRSES